MTDQELMIDPPRKFIGSGEDADLFQQFMEKILDADSVVEESES